MKNDDVAFARLLSIHYEHKQSRGDFELRVSGVNHSYEYTVTNWRTGAVQVHVKGYMRPAYARRWGRAALARIVDANKDGPSAT